jgi:hypothetical protein
LNNFAKKSNWKLHYLAGSTSALVERFTSLTVSYCLVSYTGIFKKTQKTQFTCWHSAHEILLGEPSYNFGCGYTYGTRFRKAHSSPGVAIKKQDNAKLAILAYLTKASAARPP